MAPAQRSRKETVRSETRRALWNERARLLRVVAHPVRLMILQALSENSRCVKDLNSLAAVSQPHLSQHMAALRRAKLVDCHSCGTLRCYYVLQSSLVRDLVSLLLRQYPVRFRSRRQIVQEAGHSAQKRGSRARASAQRSSKMPRQSLRS
jgi:ArsR family transcriptional regulator